MQFDDLGLTRPLARAVHDAGYRQATPIQVQAIPPALEGRDILGCAQTGTGKTAAFALPILQRLAEAGDPGKGRRPIRCLVVTPTRELAAQIGESFATYGAFLPLRSTVIFGGVNQHRQVQALERGVDILIATPGRLLDLMQQGHVRLDRVEVLVLDEADRMLDMGFINDIRAIVAKVPARRQTLFFSATMPQEIRTLANSLLDDPVAIAVTPPASAAVTVTQRVYLVDRDNKQELLAHLLDTPELEKTLVFTRTKHGADRVAKRLGRAGIEAMAIHGNKSQNARVRALRAFTEGRIQVLIASDLAARGLDIDDITHVVNFDLPNEPETYVHRIGRTGRAGATGEAISFCAAEERGFLRAIERTTGVQVEVVKDHPFRAAFDALPVDEPKRQTRGGRPAAGGNRQGQARGDRQGQARGERQERGRSERPAGGGPPRRRRRGKPAAQAQAQTPAGEGGARPPRRQRGKPEAGGPGAAGDERRSRPPRRRSRNR
jgi:ATP-dependent RNA helicase RhlE